MKGDELKALTAELMGFATPDNQARMSEILATITDDNGQTNAKLEQFQNQVNDLTAKNETLREVNTNLFLKVGEVPKADANLPNQTDPDPVPDLTYDKLFNEKGELI